MIRSLARASLQLPEMAEGPRGVAGLGYTRPTGTPSIMKQWNHPFAFWKKIEKINARPCVFVLSTVQKRGLLILRTQLDLSG